MGLLALFGVLALSPQTISPSPFACQLSPSLGKGHSSVGQLDTTSALSAACSYRLFETGRLSFWPEIEGAEYRWNRFRQNGSHSSLVDLQSRDLGLGLVGRYHMESWSIYLGLHAGQGQGRIEQTESGAADRQSAFYKNASHRRLSQEIGLERAIASRIAVSGGLVHASGRLSWDAQSGKFEGQDVDAASRLTLTDTVTDSSAFSRDQLAYESWDVRFGLRLLID